MEMYESKKNIAKCTQAPEDQAQEDCRVKSCVLINSEEKYKGKQSKKYNPLNMPIEETNIQHEIEKNANIVLFILEYLNVS